MPFTDQNVGFKEPTTSREAAESMAVSAPILRVRVLCVIEAAPTGLTADEAAARLGTSVLAVRPRITELQQGGLIQPTSMRRKNASGRSARVWVATPQKQRGMHAA